MAKHTHPDDGKTRYLYCEACDDEAVANLNDLADAMATANRPRTYQSDALGAVTIPEDDTFSDLTPEQVAAAVAKGEAARERFTATERGR